MGWFWCPFSRSLSFSVRAWKEPIYLTPRLASQTRLKFNSADDAKQLLFRALLSLDPHSSFQFQICVPRPSGDFIVERWLRIEKKKMMQQLPINAVIEWLTKSINHLNLFICKSTAFFLFLVTKPFDDSRSADFWLAATLISMTNGSRLWYLACFSG